MKKITRIAALLAAGALLFGAVGCSGGGSGSGDGDGDGSGGGGGGGSTVSENTVKGTYTVKNADLAGETLVFVGEKIYMKMDVLADEGKDSGDSDASAEKVTYNLTYESGETAHAPSYTIEEAYDVDGELYKKATEAAISGATSYIAYIEVGTYAIANGRVTGKMIFDEDTSFNATADTDDAGHLKSFTVNYSGEESGDEGEGGEPVTYDFTKLTSADVSALGITATEASDKDTGKIAKSSDEYGLSNGAFLYSKGDGNLKIRFATKNDITSAITSVNFGGQSIGDKDTTATPGDVGTTESGSASRYIALPVSASKFNVAVTYKSTNAKKVQIVVVDENGKILAKDEPNGENSEKTYTTGTLEKGSASKIRIYLYRIDDNSSGGADVSKIVVTPVSE